MSGALLAVKFLLELALLGAAAWWGAATAGWPLAIAAPLAVAVLWGRLAAPRSAHRLDRGARIAFELGMFALGAAALVSTGAPIAGAALLLGALLVTLALERPRG